jgi:hypothetical protein
LLLFGWVSSLPHSTEKRHFFASGNNSVVLNSTFNVTCDVYWRQNQK